MIAIGDLPGKREGGPVLDSILILARTSRDSQSSAQDHKGPILLRRSVDYQSKMEIIMKNEA